MKKADLHAHTRFSAHPSEWFLKRLGTRESYTEPEELYNKAKESGMDYVAVTDHNNIDGALELKQNHPDDVITGVESTVYFPEDKCKIHLLFYGINERQFSEIDALRENIYDLRDYTAANNLAYSVAHAAYSVNNKLTRAHLEKLILLFNNFEGINGARDAASNNAWMRVLNGLSPAYINKIYQKHRIRPWGGEPWVKGITGGSDDHAGLFIGRTFTGCSAQNIDGFLEAIKRKSTSSGGRHNDYYSFVFTLYKIAYDFSRANGSSMSKNFFSQLTELVFKKDRFTLGDKIKIEHFARANKKNKNRVQGLLLELVRELNAMGQTPIEKKFDAIYGKAAAVTDELLRAFFRSMEKNLKAGNIPEIVRNISSSLPGIFIAMPFFTSLNHFTQNRGMLESLCEEVGAGRPNPSKKILWFTDTLNDLNGVSNTLKTIGWKSHTMQKDLRIITSFADAVPGVEIPPNTINLPAIHSLDLPYYENYSLRLPSLLSSIRKICEFSPDEIYISTPGPVGLLGLLASKVLNVRSSGIYHTDFTSQTNKIINDEQLEALVEAGIKWFYSAMSEIKVPSFEYVKILKERGYNTENMSIFRRGIDSDHFSPQKGARKSLNALFGVGDGINLLYTGRLSKDKNLDFLVDLYKTLAETRNDLNLILAGDGPYAGELRSRAAGMKRVFFTGRQGQGVLPVIYSASDIFLFPSVTDTFGMSVLEAQSCGVPAIVSEIGGPREIILEGQTGFIASSRSIMDWKRKIEYMINLIISRPYKYGEMRELSRHNAAANYNWKEIIENMTEFSGPANADRVKTAV